MFICCFGFNFIFVCVCVFDSFNLIFVSFVHLFLVLIQFSFLFSCAKQKIILLSIFILVGEKRTVALSPKHICRKNAKISIPLKHIQFNIISYIESVNSIPQTIKNTYYCNNETLSIEDLQNSQENSFNLHFTLCSNF